MYNTILCSCASFLGRTFASTFAGCLATRQVYMREWLRGGCDQWASSDEAKLAAQPWARTILLMKGWCVKETGELASNSSLSRCGRCPASASSGAAGHVPTTRTYCHHLVGLRTTNRRGRRAGCSSRRAGYRVELRCVEEWQVVVGDERRGLVGRDADRHRMDRTPQRPRFRQL